MNTLTSPPLTYSITNINLFFVWKEQRSSCKKQENRTKRIEIENMTKWKCHIYHFSYREPADSSVAYHYRLSRLQVW